jgi:hypothetical protein
MAVEHERFAAAGALPDPDGVITFITDRLKRSSKAGSLQYLVEGSGHIAFEARRAGNVHELYDEFYQPVSINTLDCSIYDLWIYVVGHAYYLWL